MKYFIASLCAILLLFAGYLGYGFIQMKQDLFKVYDVEDKYAQGGSDADLMIVDFNQFECIHCRNLHPVLKEAIKIDGKVRYMPRFVTLDSQWSETLATAVYAAAEQNKFIEMQDSIYKNWPVESHDDLYLVARTINLDIEKFKKDLNDADLIDRTREDQTYFEDWFLKQIPTLLIGKSRIYVPSEETPTVEELLEKFNQGRS